MTTLIVNIKDSADAKKIADALRLMESVTDITFEEKAVSKWDQAIAEGAITLDEFGARFKEEIHKVYRQ